MALSDKEKQAYRRVCRCCGQTFSAQANNVLYCPECRIQMRQEQTKCAYQRRRLKREMAAIRVPL